MIEGFLFCLGFVAALFALPFIIALIPLLLCLAAASLVIGGLVFFWLVNPEAFMAIFWLASGIAIMCGASWCTGEVWDKWQARRQS